jgi:hypothetical protein
MFNYAKMEAYVPKDELIEVVNNMCFVLRSVDFNDKVLESLVGENVLDYQEESFNLFDTNSSDDNFLDVVTKYEDEEFSKSMDEEQIDLDNE